MTITTQVDLFLNTSGGNTFNVNKVASATAAAGGRWFNYFHAGNYPVAALTPTTGSGATRQYDSRGAFPINPTAAQNYLVGAEICTSTGPTQILIADLLWHNSGMSGTNISAQTVNSLALPRVSSGPTYAFMEVFTQLGTTSTTISVAYTDSNSAAQTGTIRYSGNPRMQVRQIEFMETAQGAGDKVSSIQSATLAASTGTAGNFGLGIFAPLAMVHIPSPNVIHQFDWSHLYSKFDSGACLCMFATSAPGPSSLTASVTTAPAISASFKIANG